MAGEFSLSGTISFEESVPLGQQSIPVKDGLQPKADNDVTDAMEPGHSLSEDTDSIYLQRGHYTQPRISLMLPQLSVVLCIPAAFLVSKAACPDVFQC